MWKYHRYQSKNNHLHLFLHFNLQNFDQFNFQEALKRAQLIGKFYYRKLIDSSVFFGYLYQSITLGHTIGSSGEDDGPEEMARSRLILTLLGSLRDLRFCPEFYIYCHEFMAMFRCYLSFKIELAKEIYELACDVYKVKEGISYLISMSYYCLY